MGRNELGEPVQIPDLYGLTIFEAKERLAALGSFEFNPPLVRPIYRGIAPFLADWLLSGVLLGE